MLCFKNQFLYLTLGFFGLSGCGRLKESFLLGASRVTPSLTLETLGESHKVGANQVLMSGYCSYGSQVEVSYGSGFAADNPTSASCGACSSSENPECGYFYTTVGKYSFVATLAASAGSRQIIIKSKNAKTEETSRLTRTFTYEPLSQVAYGKSSVQGSESLFGYAVDLDGDTMVVGAYSDPNNTTTPDHGSVITLGSVSQSIGAVYVFRKIVGTWVQEAYLKPSYSQGGDLFGFSVAVSGDTVAVGAYGDDRNLTSVFNSGTVPSNNTLATNSGAVYVFHRSGSTWSLESYIKAPNAQTADDFGYSLDLSGDDLVVGAYLEDNSTPGVQNGAVTTDNSSAADAGAAYVFRRTGSSWAFQSYLKAAQADASDRFGSAVSIVGDLIAVSAPNEDSNATGVTMGTTGSTNNTVSNSGAVYLFRRSGSNWAQEAFVKGHAINAGDAFGTSIALSSDTLVVGAPFEDSNVTGVVNGSNGSTNNGLSNSGAVYVFYNNSGTWSQQAYVKGSNTGADDQFGDRVAINGNTIAVTAAEEDSNLGGVQNGTTGSADNSMSNSGAVYVFTRSGVNWSQQAYLKSSVPGVNYGFGSALALGSDSLVVGEYQARSSAKGVSMGTSASYDVNTGYVGAAYTFLRSGVNWSQESFVRPPVAMVYNSFGIAVDIDGDTAIVGASNDPNPSTAIINGPTATLPSTALALTSGAAYVFRKVAGNWVQEAYLKAPNAEFNDLFGTAVAISGNTAVVGAYGEDNSTPGVQNGAIVTDNAAASGSGAAYVFVRSGSTWSFQSYLKAGVTGSHNCGVNVDVDGDTIAMACQVDSSSIGGVVNSAVAGPVDSGATNSGSVYVFKRTGVNWAQEAYLKAAVPTAETRFGYRSIKISGDVLAVSSNRESSSGTGIQHGATAGSSDTSATYSGAAWIFRRTGTTWAQEAFIKPPLLGTDTSFGYLGLNGNDLVISALWDTAGGNGVQNAPNFSFISSSERSGSVYIYKYVDGQWTLKSFIKAPSSSSTTDFGRPSDIVNDMVFIGASSDGRNASSIVHGSRLDLNSNTDSPRSGAVYSYHRLNDQWYLSDYIKPSLNMAQSTFGYRLAVSSGNLIVSAPYESGGGLGVINSLPSTPSNPIYFSGAVYFYKIGD